MIILDLSIDRLSDHFAVYRTQLNQKIKSLTGFAPNNQIKIIRLGKSYELIRPKDVGFLK